jgi:hypothetical protein
VNAACGDYCMQVAVIGSSVEFRKKQGDDSG